MMPPSGCSPTSGCRSTSGSSGWLRPACPRSAGATCWPGWSRTSTRCRTWSSGSSPPFAIAVLVGRLTVALMWWMLPAAGVILAVALLLAGTVVPWLTGALARRRESRFARVRGDLAAAMVDLTEGASELVAFGAMAAQLRTIGEHDAELTAIAVGVGRDRRDRAGPDHAAGRPGLLGLPRGRDSGRALGPPRAGPSWRSSP